MKHTIFSYQPEKNEGPRWAGRVGMYEMAGDLLDVLLSVENQAKEGTQELFNLLASY